MCHNHLVVQQRHRCEGTTAKIKANKSIVWVVISQTLMRSSISHGVTLHNLSREFFTREMAEIRGEGDNHVLVGFLDEQGSSGTLAAGSEPFTGICVHGYIATSGSVPVRAVSASVEVASVAVSNLPCYRSWCRRQMIPLPEQFSTQSEQQESSVAVRNHSHVHKPSEWTRKSWACFRCCYF